MPIAKIANYLSFKKWFEMFGKRRFMTIEGRHEGVPFSFRPITFIDQDCHLQNLFCSFPNWISLE